MTSRNSGNPDCQKPPATPATRGPAPVRLAERLVVLAIILFLAPKLSALLVVALHWALRRLYSCRRAAIVFTVDVAVFFAAILVPVDIYIPWLHGPIYGDRHGGPRLVRAIVGMPMTQRCIERYGEFVSLGCSAMPGAPTWVLVWK